MFTIIKPEITSEEQQKLNAYKNLMSTLENGVYGDQKITNQNKKAFITHMLTLGKASTRELRLSAFLRGFQFQKI